MIQIHEKSSEYGQPVPAGDRFWVRLDANPTAIGEIVASLAQRSIGFTFEADGSEYEITTEHKYRLKVEGILARAELRHRED